MFESHLKNPAVNCTQNSSRQEKLLLIEDLADRLWVA